jgi:hypothetical protein
VVNLWAGLAEYTCFLAAVLGLLLMRSRERHDVSRCQNGLSRNSSLSNRSRSSPPSCYSFWIGNPVVFSMVSAFLILRAVATGPFRGLAILLVVGSGVAGFSITSGQTWAN